MAMVDFGPTIIRKIDALVMQAVVKRWWLRRSSAAIRRSYGRYRRSWPLAIACRHPSWCRYWGWATMHFMVMVFSSLVRCGWRWRIYTQKHSGIGLWSHKINFFISVSYRTFVWDICWPRVNILLDVVREWKSKSKWVGKRHIVV